MALGKWYRPGKIYRIWQVTSNGGPLQFFEEDWGKIKSWLTLGKRNRPGKIYRIWQVTSNEGHWSYLKKIEKIKSWLALGKWNRSGRIYRIWQVTSNERHCSYLKKIEENLKADLFWENEIALGRFLEFDSWRAMRAIEVIWRRLRKFISWLALGKWNRPGKIFRIWQVTSNESHCSYLKKIEENIKTDWLWESDVAWERFLEFNRWRAMRDIAVFWRRLRNLKADLLWENEIALERFSGFDSFRAMRDIEVIWSKTSRKIK